jgi:hypothetical protein
MRVIRIMDSKENLCDSCAVLGGFPMCKPDYVEFGNGIGNDNVIACSSCTSPYLDVCYPAELAPKEGDTNDHD